MFHFISTLVLLVLALGVWLRHRRKLHISLMISAFTMDVLLVLFIEVQRHAVEKIVQNQVSPFVMFHAGISLIVLVLYTAMACLGYQILKNKPGARKWHRLLSLFFGVFRLTNYVTSFFVTP